MKKMIFPNASDIIYENFQLFLWQIIIKTFFMKRKTNNIVIGSFIFLLLTGSCNKKKDTFPINIIPVANTVGTYSILNLSDYAENIRYIPLETNDKALITPLSLQIIYENEKILIVDHTTSNKKNCYLFDSTGKFCQKIGQQGQGPDDYLDLANVSIYENLIYLMTWHKILIYDTTGHLVEKIDLKSEEIPEEYRRSWLRRIIPLKNNAFIVNVATMLGYYPTAYLFETNQSIVESIKEYPNSVKLDKLGSGISSGDNELGCMYRYKDNVRIYKSINDTIFTIDQNTEMQEAFIFELGKYKPTRTYFEGKSGGADRVQRLQNHINQSKNFIFPHPIYESLNHLFISFDFGIHAPESFEFINLAGFQGTNNFVYSVFDKNTGELTLMRQPIKGKLGFKNDIDNGPIIWPNYISSKNELVTFILPEDFMEYYNNIKNPSAVLKEIAGKLMIDDNPIVIVSKLKE
jgi:hypothetical protein